MISNTNQQMCVLLSIHKSNTVQYIVYKHTGWRGSEAQTAALLHSKARQPPRSRLSGEKPHIVIH